jgi:hypothetical protein
MDLRIQLEKGLQQRCCWMGVRVGVMGRVSAGVRARVLVGMQGIGIVRGHTPTLVRSCAVGIHSCL